MNHRLREQIVETYRRAKIPLKIFIYLMLFYLSIGFYGFCIFMVLITSAYFLSEYLVSGVLVQYRDLLDEQSKIRFDAMTKNEQIKCLDENAKTHGHENVIYIKDTINALYTCVGKCF